MRCFRNVGTDFYFGDSLSQILGLDLGIDLHLFGSILDLIKCPEFIGRTWEDTSYTFLLSEKIFDQIHSSSDSPCKGP